MTAPRVPKTGHNPTMKEVTVNIINKLGLHARAAAKVVHAANEFVADVFIGTEYEVVNAKSILGLLTLAATRGTSVIIRTEGSDEDRAIETLVNLFLDKFGEGE